MTIEQFIILIAVSFCIGELIPFIVGHILILIAKWKENKE